MKYTLNGELLPGQIQVDPDINCNVHDLAAEEDLLSFVKKLVVKIGTAFNNHKAMVADIKGKLAKFDDLNKEAIVVTVKPKDLSAVANALQETNEALQKLRLGQKVETSEFCSPVMEQAGITYERGRISVANFKSGNWGDGRDKTGLDHPMTYHKKIEEFGWDRGAKVYAERFCQLASDVVGKDKLVEASNRHYADVKNAMMNGIGKNRAIFEKEVALDQINQINSVRDMLIKFYYDQLKAVLKGAYIPLPKKDEGVLVPNTWKGQ